MEEYQEARENQPYSFEGGIAENPSETYFMMPPQTPEIEVADNRGTKSKLVVLAN